MAETCVIYVFYNVLLVSKLVNNACTLLCSTRVRSRALPASFQMAQPQVEAFQEQVDCGCRARKVYSPVLNIKVTYGQLCQ
jgi:hypothetical protein